MHLLHPVILSEAKDLCTFRAIGSSPSRGCSDISRVWGEHARSCPERSRRATVKGRCHYCVRPAQAGKRHGDGEEFHRWQVTVLSIMQV
jgi:hypothetical protein